MDFLPSPERFEKLDPFPIVGFQRKFLKAVKRSAVAEQPYNGFKELWRGP
jgi:hypothetical protein